MKYNLNKSEYSDFSPFFDFRRYFGFNTPLIGNGSRASCLDGISCPDLWRFPDWLMLPRYVRGNEWHRIDIRQTLLRNKGHETKEQPYARCCTPASLACTCIQTNTYIALLTPLFPVNCDKVSFVANEDMRKIYIPRNPNARTGQCRKFIFRSKWCLVPVGKVSRQPDSPN